MTQRLLLPISQALYAILFSPSHETLPKISVELKEHNSYPIPAILANCCATSCGVPLNIEFALTSTENRIIGATFASGKDSILFASLFDDSTISPFRIAFGFNKLRQLRILVTGASFSNDCLCVKYALADTVTAKVMKHLVVITGIVQMCTFNHGKVYKNWYFEATMHIEDQLVAVTLTLQDNAILVVGKEPLNLKSFAEFELKDLYARSKMLFGMSTLPVNISAWEMEWFPQVSCTMLNINLIIPNISFQCEQVKFSHFAFELKAKVPSLRAHFVEHGCIVNFELLEWGKFHIVKTISKDLLSIEPSKYRVTMIHQWKGADLFSRNYFSSMHFAVKQLPFEPAIDFYIEKPITEWIIDTAYKKQIILQTPRVMKPVYYKIGPVSQLALYTLYISCLEYGHSGTCSISNTQAVLHMNKQTVMLSGDRICRAFESGTQYYESFATLLELLHIFIRPLVCQQEFIIMIRNHPATTREILLNCATMRITIKGTLQVKDIALPFILSFSIGCIEEAELQLSEYSVLLYYGQSDRSIKGTCITLQRAQLLTDICIVPVSNK